MNITASQDEMAECFGKSISAPQKQQFYFEILRAPYSVPLQFTRYAVSKEEVLKEFPDAKFHN